MCWWRAFTSSSEAFTSTETPVWVPLSRRVPRAVPENSWTSATSWRNSGSGTTRASNGGSAETLTYAATDSANGTYHEIADNAGAGIDNAAGGSATIERSVLHGNAGGDLANVACTSASWSAVGVPDCSAVNDNLAADPLLAADYRLLAGSPCLELIRQGQRTTLRVHFIARAVKLGQPRRFVFIGRFAEDTMAP